MGLSQPGTAWGCEPAENKQGVCVCARPSAAPGRTQPLPTGSLAPGRRPSPSSAGHYRPAPQCLREAPLHGWGLTRAHTHTHRKRRGQRRGWHRAGGNPCLKHSGRGNRRCLAPQSGLDAVTLQEQIQRAMEIRHAIQEVKARRSVGRERGRLMFRGPSAEVRDR